MNTSVEIDLIHIPLIGRNLIEASAGTGKTYTIAGLYTRLIVEKQLNVDNILVMTFTNAAREELRSRLRQALANALKVIAGEGSDTDDPFLRELAIQHSHDEMMATTAIKKLKLALCDFDQASIYTIHGFCQRMLQDVAVETGVAFENELVSDDSELGQKIVDDFWRKRFFNASNQRLNQLASAGVTPETLKNSVFQWIAKPYLKILPLQQDSACQAIDNEMTLALEYARRLWGESAVEIKTLLKEHESLDKRSYSKKNVPGWIKNLEAMLESGEIDPASTAALRFMTQGIAEKTKLAYEPLKHPFFDSWEQLVLLSKQRQLCDRQSINQLRFECLQHLRSELKRIKRDQRLFNYDDLLLHLHQALSGETGAGLARRISKQFPAALIDEFQDTDPVQYEIFDSIYARNGRSDHALFLVGDPKQAIYSFRGADIHTYLRARKTVREPWWTLTQNWRSSQSLVAAINQLFERHQHPFWLDKISYQKVIAAQGKTLDSHLPDGMPALRCWFVNNPVESEKPLTKTDATALIVEAVANEIAELLNRGMSGQFNLDSQALGGGDIAVLVRKKAQGELIRNALTERGIASVLLTHDSVFHTLEAQQLVCILNAVLQPTQQGLIRAALATDILGLNAEQIAELEHDEVTTQLEWDQWLERFRQWHQFWLERGFMQMFRMVIDSGDCYRRWLKLADGERRMTNLLHLGELIHQQNQHNALGLQGMVNWFNRQRDSTDEAAQLRLESDENLVRIVTIHASKGLEYNLVFCPFLWDGGAASRSDNGLPFVYHDPKNDDTAYLDMGSDVRAEGLQLAQDEAFAEDLRLLYVALTRAKYHCTLVTGHLSSLENSALGWLLYGNPTLTERDHVISQIKNLSAEEKLEALKVLTMETDGALQWCLLPHNENRVTFKPTMHDRSTKSAKQFTGEIGISRQLTSFSLLTQGIEHNVHQIDAEEPDPVADCLLTTDQFPGGTQAGICLHKMLEKLDFTRPVAEQIPVLHEALAGSYFGAEQEQLVHIVIPWLQTVLATPFDSENRFCLQQLANKNRIDELGFFYPVNALNRQAIKPLLHDYCPNSVIRSTLNQLQAAQMKGWMRGFIDLVYRRHDRYYLVDYKSNWLGNTNNAYSEQNLVKTIADRQYYLQYLIYSVALHRFLTLRVADYDYQRHFGGVYYLFIRGMSVERPGAGVYFDRPAQQLIEALSQLFSQ